MKANRPHCGWVVAILFGLVLWPARAGAEEGWLHEFDEALAAAKQQGKDILIDFSGTDWCLPCKRLWNQTLSQQDFIKLASRRFVLLDVDDLASATMPEGRKERYEALQKRYAIQAFPTVVLATPDGLPYAATGMVAELNNPRAYWQHLEQLYERGQTFKAALAAAGGPRGLTDARSIVAALAEVRPDFVNRFYSDKLAQLRKLKPPDETGYLAFIDARTELLAMEWKLHEQFLVTYDKWSAGQAIEGRWFEAFAPRDVDALIEKHKLRDASLQEALLARALLEIDAGQWREALSTLDAMGALDATPSRFEQANFVRLSIRTADLRRHVSEGRAAADDPLAQLRAVYRIVREDLESQTPTSCCNHSFTVQVHQLVAGAAYGELLRRSTAHLKGEERARAIGKGLGEVELWFNGSISRLVREELPEMAGGKEAARKCLPPRYAEWLDD